MSAFHFCTLEETKEGGLSKLNELDVLFCGILLVHNIIHTVVSGFCKSTNVSIPTLRGGY